MSTPEWLATSSVSELEKSLVKINAKIEELKAVDWTARIANAVRRDQARAQEFVELERDAADDLRLAEGRKLACEQRIAEVKEAERVEKLGPIRDDHAKAIADCGASLKLKQAKKALDALNRALSDYEGARAAAGQAIVAEFDALDFAPDRDAATELYLSKPGQAGLSMPISREMHDLAVNLGAAATRAGFLADRLPIGRILAPSIEITGEKAK